jgi:hypothetical protein
LFQRKIFRRKIFLTKSFFRKNDFIENIFIVWLLRKNHQRQKTIGNEISSMAGGIPTQMARFRPILPESSQFRQILAIGYKKSGTFSVRFYLLTNSNAQQ